MIFVSCLLLGGCPGTLDDPEAFRPCTPETVPTKLFVNKCSGIGCHDSKEPGSGLDLTSPGVEARLIDQYSKFIVPNEEDSGIMLGPDGGPLHDCEDRLLIDPANPSTSFLLDKVTKTKPECGDQMPAIGTLSAKEIQCITDWVQGLVDAGAGSGGSAGSSPVDASAEGASTAGAGGL